MRLNSLVMLAAEDADVNQFWRPLRQSLACSRYANEKSTFEVSYDDFRL